MPGRKGGSPRTAREASYPERHLQMAAYPVGPARLPRRAQSISLGQVATTSLPAAQPRARGLHSRTTSTTRIWLLFWHEAGRRRDVSLYAIQTPSGSDTTLYRPGSRRRSRCSFRAGGSARQSHAVLRAYDPCPTRSTFCLTICPSASLCSSAFCFICRGCIFYRNEIT